MEPILLISVALVTCLASVRGFDNDLMPLEGKSSDPHDNLVPYPIHHDDESLLVPFKLDQVTPAKAPPSKDMKVSADLTVAKDMKVIPTAAKNAEDSMEAAVVKDLQGVTLEGRIDPLHVSSKLRESPGFKEKFQRKPENLEPEESEKEEDDNDSFAVPDIPDDKADSIPEDSKALTKFEKEQEAEQGIVKSGRLSSDDLVFKFKRIEANVEDILHEVMSQYIERYQVLMKYKDQLAVQDAKVLEIQMALEQSRNETAKRIQTESLQFLFDTSKLMEEKRQLQDQIEFIFKARNNEVSLCRSNNKRIGDLIDSLDSAKKNRLLNIKNSLRALESAVALS